jgi:hypothetical protein
MSQKTNLGLKLSIYSTRQDANLHGTDYARYKQKVLARDYYFEDRSASESDDDEAGLDY